MTNKQIEHDEVGTVHLFSFKKNNVVLFQEIIKILVDHYMIHLIYEIS